jgi:flotillin
MDTPQIIGIALGLGVVAILLLIIFIKTNIVLCQPNELVVISGRQRKLADGTMIGYRVLRGGRGFKRPLVESVGRMPLNSIPIEIQIDDVMTDGMIPVAIEARATVKLAGREADGMDAAIERFLGKGVDAVAKTAAQALEGAIRGVVATMSPEEANSKRLELAQQGSSIAREDLKRLGIVLDFLQIQEVNDKQGYLAAIGRRRNAAVQRDAKVAEAMAEAEARQVAAEQQRVGREAEITSEQAIIKRENALAVESRRPHCTGHRGDRAACQARRAGREEEGSRHRRARGRNAEGDDAGGRGTRRPYPRGRQGEVAGRREREPVPHPPDAGARRQGHPSGLGEPPDRQAHHPGRWQRRGLARLRQEPHQQRDHDVRADDERDGCGHCPAGQGQG